MSEYPLPGIAYQSWTAYVGRTQESGIVLVNADYWDEGGNPWIDFCSVTTFLTFGDNWAAAALFLGDGDGNPVAPLFGVDIGTAAFIGTDGQQIHTYTNETPFPFPSTNGDGASLVLVGTCSTINSSTGFSAFACGRTFTAGYP